MALPVTITGISTAVPIAGPFKVAAGGYGVKALEIVGGGTGQNAPIEGPTGEFTYARGQEFINGGSPLTIATVSFPMTKTGTPTGNIWAQIYNGSPYSGTHIATSDQIAASVITSTAFPGGTLVTFTFPSLPTIAASALFTVSVHRTDGDTVNTVNLSYIAGSTYPSQLSWAYTSSTGWQQQGIDYHATVNSLVTIASDAYYFFGRDGTTATTLSAYKSTAPDTSWASIATKTGFTTAILNLIGYQVGPTIHMLVQDGTASTSQAVKYVSYDALTDTFLAATETVSAAGATTGQISGAGTTCSLVVRPNGEAVALYNGLQTKTSGTFRARIYYRRRTALNTWSTETQVDPNIANDCSRPVAVLGASNRVHFFFDLQNASTQYRTLSAANAQSTIKTTSSMLVGGPGDGVSYDRSGVIKCVVLNGGAGAITANFDSSSDDPTATIVNHGAGTPNASLPKRIGADATTKDVTIVYRNSGNSDFYAVKSTNDGASFGTAVVFFAGTIASAEANVSRNPSGGEYQRGNNIVIGYVVNDGGTLKYNEYLVRTLAALPIENYVKHAGVWKKPIATHVKHAGTWKTATTFVKHAGAWKQMT